MSNKISDDVIICGTNALFERVKRFLECASINRENGIWHVTMDAYMFGFEKDHKISAQHASLVEAYKLMAEQLLKAVGYHE